MDVTRFAPPRPSTRRVPRDRLLEVIDATPSGGVCVVTGGPGFGKTQLLSDWVDRPDVRAAWLTVDVTDNDPARLWHHLDEAWRRADLGAALDAEDTGDLDAFLRLVTGPSVDAPVWLVIDDAHLLVDEAVRTELGRLVACLTGELRLAVASRVELPWSLARWRARGLVVDIRERALALRRDEVDQLVVAAGLDVSAPTVERLTARTEGWAAGVQLAIRGALEGDDPERYLARVRGDDESIADFLLEEALDHQPADRRRFLLETSILDRLSGSSCDAVTGRRDSARMLAELARDHVLVNRLDGEDVAWYRCHALFAELLRAELAADDPELACELHRRAGAWLAANGEIDRAVHHLLAGGRVEDATALVLAHEDEYFRLGQVALLRGWYDALPEVSVADPDGRLLRLIWASLAAGEEPAVWEPALNQLRRRAARAEDTSTLAAELAVIDAHLAARIGDAPTMRDRCREAIDRFAAQSVGRDRPAVAYVTLLDARAAVWDGALDNADELVAAALADPAVTDPTWILAFEASRSAVDAERGRHAVALARAEAALAGRTDVNRHATGGLEAGLARVMALRGLGRAEEAVTAVDDARELARTGVVGAPYLVLLGVEEARLALDRGDLDGARAALRSAPELPRFQRGTHDVAATLGAWREATHRREGITSLTERELDVLARLPTRLTLQEIADELFVSLNTVKTHVKNIYAKLHVTNRDAAARRAEELHLTSR